MSKRKYTKEFKLKVLKERLETCLRLFPIMSNKACFSCFSASDFFRLKPTIS